MSDDSFFGIPEDLSDLMPVYAADKWPDRVTFCGILFRKATWVFPMPGIVVQYRECVARRSLHLKVHKDGRYLIGHFDQYNPDQGHPVKHLLSDVLNLI